MIHRLLLCLIVASLLWPAVSAGTQEDPEIVDAAGDASFSAGACSDGVPEAICEVIIDDDSTSDAADLLAIWITEPNATHYRIHVQTAAAGDDDTTIGLTYNVTPTEISRHTGEAEHTVQFEVTGTTPAEGAPANTTASRNEEDPAILEITVTRADTGAVGGDAITQLHVAAEDTEEKGDQVTRTDTTTDAAPDEGTSRPFNLTRPPIVADLELVATGGFITQTINGSTVNTAFDGSQANLDGDNGTVTYNLTLTNAGTDPDSATIAVFDPTGTLAAKNITATVSPSSTAQLLPGATADLTFRAVLDGAPSGEHILLASAESARGGAAAVALTVQVPAPPAPTPPPTGTQGPGDDEPAERSPVAGLGFLTPMAEALGFDEAFGDWAEVVLLAILLLLLIIVIFLVVLLVGRRSIVVDVEPRSIDARPGEVAEFTVNVRNRKKRQLDALAQFDGDPAWSTAMAFGDAELRQPHTDARMGLGPKGADSGTRTGKLRVRVPETAGEKETDRITLGVAALDDEGRPKKRREATVRVRARDSAVAEGLPMRMSSVDHQPAEPSVGDTVATTARLENDSEEETLHLRVVLNLDGEDIQEQPVVLPPHSARAIVFRWQVPSGSSKVRVRVFRAEG